MENEKEIKKKEEEISELEEQKKKCDEYLNNWKRERADFINYKNAEGERIESLMQYSLEKMILKLLPILDNFYLAETQMPDDLKDNKWVQGLLQSKNELIGFLQAYGVEEIKAKNDDFDPNIQEAVEMVESEGVESGKVIEIIKKGYKLNKKVIRPIGVRISK